MRFLQKVSETLFRDKETREIFVASVQAGASSAQAVIWLKDRPPELPFECEAPTLLQPAFTDRVPEGCRPGSYRLHEEGYYYVLDFSSLFCASAVLEVSDQQCGLLLDVCASPGGKGIFAWRALSPELLIANEVIGKRIPALSSNLSRCSISPAWIVRNDSKVLAQALEDAADVVIVDAPCSGQSLLAKGQDAPGCFHPSNINLNANRQRRIIANASKCVAPGGYLAYMTCTYAPKENEETVAWLLQRFPEFQAVEVSRLQAYRSKLAEFPAYRLWPFQGMGAGGFTALLRRSGASPTKRLKNIEELRSGLSIVREFSSAMV